ncbi:hypothetical protein DL96DRAFT_1464504, partial [Flagelloscypha sp. PMI_526]
QQFIHVHAPVSTGNDAEGAGETFKLAPVPLRGGGTEEFSPPAGLTVSAQRCMEAVTQSVGRTWVLWPASGKADTSAMKRHLAEFWMLEANEFRQAISTE